jgi:hypothetical protein
MAGTSWLKTPNRTWLIPARKQQRNGLTDIQNYHLNWELKATAEGTVFGQGCEGLAFGPVCGVPLQVLEAFRGGLTACQNPHLTLLHKCLNWRAPKSQVSRPASRLRTMLPRIGRNESYPQ